MKKELQRIANTLVLYNYHIQQIGLLNGKTGIILFLYRYAEYSGHEYYRELADKLLDDILKSVARTPTDFENGLSGIGWSINTLIKGEYVDGDPNDVLQDLDKKIFSNLKCNPSTSIFAQGIYLIKRLTDNPDDIKFQDYTFNCLEFCHKGIGNYKGKTSLYHINSLLYFLLNVEKNTKFKVKVNSIKKLLPKVLEKTFNDKIYDDADLFIFHRILDEIKPEIKSKWKKTLVFKPSIQSIEFKTETVIKISWQEDLYFENSKLPKMSLEEVSHFINNKQESLTINDFLFPKGLAGFGNMLLSTYPKNKE